MLPPGWVQVAPGGMRFGAGDHRVLLADLMEGEAYSQLGLEEVKYDDQYNRWEITLGLNRSWNVEKQSSGAAYTAPIYGPASTTSRQVRTYKTIYLDGPTGNFISMDGPRD
jgi:hypothetical protein